MCICAHMYLSAYVYLLDVHTYVYNGQRRVQVRSAYIVDLSSLYKQKWKEHICICTPLCVYIQSTESVLFWSMTSHIHLFRLWDCRIGACVCKQDFSSVTAAGWNWEFITENGKFLPETFWPRASGEKYIYKNSRTTACRTKLPRFGAELRQPGSPEVSNCSLRQKPPCPSPKTEQLHLSSLNLLAPISFFLPFGLPFDVWRELIYLFSVWSHKKCWMQKSS